MREYKGKCLGQLKIIDELEPHITPNGSKQRIVKCQCSCGNVFTTRLTTAIKNQKCRNCLNKERRADITGKRFGKLIVLSMADDYISPSGQRLSRCKCLCDCGNTIVVNMSSLVSGKTKSCGCVLNSRGLLKDNIDLLKKYDFDRNQELGLDFNSLTARSAKKIWWKCDICGNSWFATIASQNDEKKHGCPYCTGRLVIKGQTDLSTLFPEIAAEWDYEKNGDISPSEISSKSSKKVWWICSEGHEWQATVGNRTHNRSGCPRCSIEKTNSFCEQAIYYYIKKVYPDAINSDYHLGLELDIYIPSINTAVEYDGEAWHSNSKRIKNDQLKNQICSDAGVKLIRIREPKLPVIDNCTIIVRKDSTTSNSLNDAISELLHILGNDISAVDTDSDSGYILEQYATKKYINSLESCFPEIAKEWHPTKNGKLTPDRVSKGSRRAVWWRCEKGHEWQAIVSERTRPVKVRENGTLRKPYGCPYCSGRRIKEGINDLQTLDPLIAKEWHPTKNGDLLPSMVTVHSGKRVWWRCEKGHEWQTSIGHRTSRHSVCPICYAEKRSPSVVCIETGELFKNAKEAGKTYGINRTSDIYKCCRGEIKEAGGYHWKYNSK